MSAVRAIAAALALVAVPAGTAAAVRPTATSHVVRDWTHSFDVTSSGGFRMGNPQAKIAIVEYGSLTCPHCRHFAETAVKPLLEQYVRTGKASYEFRPFVLNGIDLAATLVARCGGPSRFFAIAEQLYATQTKWIDNVGKLPKSEQDKFDTMPQDQLMLTFAKASGFLPVAAAHGIVPGKSLVCLKDQDAANKLMEIEQAGEELGVKGTPTFFVNGKQVPAYDWASLEPYLKEADG